MNILIADDEHIQTLIVEKQLKLIKNDITVFFAKSGKEACELINIQKFHLVIMDMHMPEMSGIDATLEIRKKIGLQELPIIMLTKESSKIELEKAFESGINDFIRKPLEPLEFRARIKSVIALTSSFESLKLQSEIIKENSRNILNQNKVLEDSIRYAKKLQKASLGSENKLQLIFKNSFICFKPRDIIGGDFYWFYENENYKFIVIADCTGHGVPGALISILGITLLKEIVIANNIISPAEILNELNKKMIDSFIKKQDIEQVDDGMDISICRFDKYNNVVISSTNQTVYIIKNKDLIEIEGSIYNISGLLSDNLNVKYIDSSLKLKSGDYVFMTTDGYKDQIGGLELKKIGSTKLKNLILENYNLPVQEQKEIFKNYIKHWMSKHKQIDDILFLGIQI